MHSRSSSAVNSVSWAPYELGAILACASSDGTISVLTFKSAYLSEPHCGSVLTSSPAIIRRKSWRSFTALLRSCLISSAYIVHFPSRLIRRRRHLGRRRLRRPRHRLQRSLLGSRRPAWLPPRPPTLKHPPRPGPRGHTKREAFRERRL